MGKYFCLSAPCFVVFCTKLTEEDSSKFILFVLQYFCMALIPLISVRIFPIVVFPVCKLTIWD